MTDSQILHPSLTENKTAYSEAFAAAQPFKHVDIPNFFDDGLVTRILEQFPSPPKEGWLTYSEKRVASMLVTTFVA